MYNTKSADECVQIIHSFTESEPESLVEVFTELSLGDVIREYEDKYTVYIQYKSNLSLFVSYLKDRDVYEFSAWVDFDCDPLEHIDLLQCVEEVSGEFCEVLSGDRGAYIGKMNGYTEECDDIKYSMVCDDGSIRNNPPW